jgi:uroporphyrinogen-III decarboxylase
MAGPAAGSDRSFVTLMGCGRHVSSVFTRSRQRYLAANRSSINTSHFRSFFNLGHGVLPETPIAHVEQLVARVRGLSPRG